MNKILISILLVIGVFFTSCGKNAKTYNDQMDPTLANYSVEEYQAALELIDALFKSTENTNKGEKNQYLLLLEKGKIALANGDYDTAIECFQEAESRFLLIEGTVSVPEGLGTLLSDDTNSEYEAEVHEKMLISPYLVLAYLGKGDFDGARIERNRTITKIHQYIEQNPELEYLENPFARYISALIYEMEDKTDDARIAYQKLGMENEIDRLEKGRDVILKTTSSEEPQEKDVSEKTTETDKSLTSTGETASEFMERIDKEIDEMADGKDTESDANTSTETETETSQTEKKVEETKKEVEEIGTGDIVIFVDVGQAPMKYGIQYGPEQVTVPGVGETISVGFIYPAYEPIESSIASINVSVNGETQGKTNLLYDLENTVLNEYKEKEGKITAKIIARILVKAAAQIGSKKAAEQAPGLFGSILSGAAGLAGDAWVSSEQADLRCWRTLPKKIDYKRINNLPVGEYSITLDCGIVQLTREVAIERHGDIKILHFVVPH